MRDESIHLAFGVDLINTIIAENPAVWTDAFKKEIVELIKHAVYLEKKYAYDACPQGLLGINAQQFCDYVEYIADRRLERIGLPKVYFKENPFMWMSQSVDLLKEKNFFETRVTKKSGCGASALFLCIHYVRKGLVFAQCYKTIKCLFEVLSVWILPSWRIT